MSPKMGQKLTDKPKNKLIQVRMDKETVEKLDYLATKQDSDRSKIIRQGIELQYESFKKIKQPRTDQSTGCFIRVNTPKRLINLLYFPPV